MDRIAVLIPCYNEEQTIAKVIADTKAYLPEAVIYVYNNNSTDDTVKLAKESGAIVRNEYKRANEPIGPWIDGVSMSDDRRWPITNAYRERVGE